MKLIVTFAYMTVAQLALASNAGSSSDTLSKLSRGCGYDLDGKFLAAIKRSSLENTGDERFRAEFEVRPNGWASRSRVRFVFNCAGQNKRLETNTGSSSTVATSSKTTAANPVSMSAAAVIEEEDAGGRYARRVVSERVVTAKNWRGTVARVDSILGDGRRQPLTFLLVCDSKLSRSCIEVHVEPAIQQPTKKLESIYELISAISHSP
jgi:hypothetical protein